MNLSKRTAERMLQNIDKRLQALAAEQQAMNGNVGGKKMAKGGRVKMQTLGEVPEVPKFNWDQPFNYNIPQGGYTQRQQSWLNGVQGFANDPYKINFGSKQLGMPEFAPLPSYSHLPNSFAGGTKPVAVSDENLARIAPPTLPTSHLLPNSLLDPTRVTTKPGSLVGASGANDIQTKTQGGNGFDWNNLLGLAPTIFNSIAGLTSGKADVLNPNEFQNPYESQAFGMMPSQFRVDDMLTDNRNAYTTYLRNVNQTGNSRGERMANYGAGMNRMNEANTRAWALKNNQEADMATRKAMLRNDQGNRRAGINLTVRDMNDANKGASRNRRTSYLAAAAEGAQRYGLTQQQMANQNTSQDAYINALRNMNPYMAKWLGLDDLNIRKNNG